MPYIYEHGIHYLSCSGNHAVKLGFNSLRKDRARMEMIHSLQLFLPDKKNYAEIMPDSNLMDVFVLKVMLDLPVKLNYLVCAQFNLFLNTFIFFVVTSVP